MTRQPRICTYVLPGRARSVLDAIPQAQDAERLGFDAVFVSERWESKEISATLGALTQHTASMGLVAGLTHFGTRHPLVLAGIGATVQELSGRRLTLGFGRGVPGVFQDLGIARHTDEDIADYVRILRTLWRGQAVDYTGPIGTFTSMRLGRALDSPPPLLFGAIGPRALRLAGATFDAVVLHPFLTEEGVARSRELVRAGAVAAGRDPSDIHVYATVVCAPDGLSAERIDSVVRSRAVSYFMHPAIGRALSSMNGWDPEHVEKVRAAGVRHLEMADIAPEEYTRRLAAVARLLPDRWIERGSVTGPVPRQVARLRDYAAAGADSILLHGPEPAEQSTLMAALRPSPTLVAAAAGDTSPKE